MGKQKKTKGSKGSGTANPGNTAKVRHNKRKYIHAAADPSRLVALPEKHISQKHQSYFELVENKDKRKKLEFQVTSNLRAPPGFEFVPIGNPDLTTACKELSREQDAMIFIVSNAKDVLTNSLSLQLNRIGHHVRRTIVEQARIEIGQEEDFSDSSHTGQPEPIPERQEEINAQADGVLKDLFPRIPNTDRQMIIDHAFRKGATFLGAPVVGMATNIPLSRRVQLAVLAHIRHTHTRYDQLLREAGYAKARVAVEQPCLDILVKWRGDEETGRDQLDEILREVVVISDSESESDGSDDDDDNDDEGQDNGIGSADQAPVPEAIVLSSQESPPAPMARVKNIVGGPHQPRKRPSKPISNRKLRRLAARGGQAPGETGPSSAKNPAGSKKVQRGFRRYEAEAQRHLAWEDALNRSRHARNPDPAPAAAAPVNGVTTRELQRRRPLEVDSPGRREYSVRDGHLSPTRQPFFYDTEPQRNGAEMHGYAAANHHRLDPAPTPNHPNPSSTPPREVVIGHRTVAAQPGGVHDARPGPVPARDNTSALRDYLVRSIEPVSPQATAQDGSRIESHHGPRDVPQFVRHVPLGEHGRQDQVSSGRFSSLVGHDASPATRAMDREYYQDRRFESDAPRLVRAPENSGHHVDRSDRYRDAQFHISSSGPGPVRTFRPREDLRGHLPSQERSLLEMNGFVLIETPRLAVGDRRYQENNPHHIIQTRRAGDDLPRGPPEYVGASARRFVSMDHAPGGHAVYSRSYEVRPAPPTGQYVSVEPASAYSRDHHGRLERFATAQPHASHDPNDYRPSHEHTSGREVLVQRHDRGQVALAYERCLVLTDHSNRSHEWDRASVRPQRTVVHAQHARPAPYPRPREVIVIR